MRIRYRFVALLWALPAGAQPLASLVDEALRNNREILAAQKKYEAARQRPSQAGSLPDPTVSLGYTSNGGPWPIAGIGTAATSNAGISISQEMPFPGKRKLREEIAGKEAAAEFQNYLAVRLSVVERLKQAYHELHHATVGIAFVGRYRSCSRISSRSPKRATRWGAPPSKIFSRHKRNSPSSRRSFCATGRTRLRRKSKSTLS